MHWRRCLTILTMIVLATGTLSAAEIQLLPSSARLNGPKAPPAVPRRSAPNRASFVGDLSGKATFRDRQSQGCDRRGSDGTVTPVGNGLATLSATVDEGRQAVLSVENVERDVPWSFKNHVLPVLDESGLQFGGLPWRGGGEERLAADGCAGYGPEVDYDVLTRQALGGRIVKTSTAESLLLFKPTGAVEQGGGVKFATDSLEYRVLAEWIAAGTPARERPPLLGLAVVPMPSC